MSEFDQDLKVGDIIYAYHKGVHEVTSISRRFHTQNDIDRFGEKYGKVGEEYSSLIHYKTFLNSKGKKCKSSSTKSCDAAFCTKITLSNVNEQEHDDIKEIRQKYSTIRDLLNAN